MSDGMIKCYNIHNIYNYVKSRTGMTKPFKSNKKQHTERAINLLSMKKDGISQ
jgi:uncharacterized protein with ATP-grasp and redox domains